MKTIINNIGQLVKITDHGKPRTGAEMEELDIQKNCSLIIEDGRISDILSADKTGRTGGEKVIDVGGKVVIPGLCDSHTHLVFAGSRAHEFEMRIKGATYMQIMQAGGGIQNTVNSTRDISFQELILLSQKRLADTMRYGTTSLEIKSGYGLDKDTELKQLKVANELKKINPHIKTTFMGAHSLPPEFRTNGEYLDFLEKEVLPEVLSENLADFIDIFCEKGVFTPEEAQRHLSVGREMGLTPKMHADELAYSGGAEIAALVGAISADHLLKASDEGLASMAKENVIATLLPATLYNLKAGEYQRARYMIDELDMAVALASDFNPGSSYCENLFFSMHLSCQYLSMTPAEVLSACTLNGAYAMGLEKETGSIDVGKSADLLVLDCHSYQEIPYHFGINPVISTIKSGEVVYRAG